MSNIMWQMFYRDRAKSGNEMECLNDIAMVLGLYGDKYNKKKLTQSINSPAIFLFLKQKQCSILKIIVLATNVVCQK